MPEFPLLKSQIGQVERIGGSRTYTTRSVSRAIIVIHHAHAIVDKNANTLNISIHNIATLIMHVHTCIEDSTNNSTLLASTQEITVRETYIIHVRTVSVFQWRTLHVPF